MDETDSLKAKGNRINPPIVSAATDCRQPNKGLLKARTAAKIKQSRIPTRTYEELGWTSHGLR